MFSLETNRNTLLTKKIPYFPVLDRKPMQTVSKSQMIGKFVPTFVFLLFSIVRLSCVKLHVYRKSLFIFHCFCLLFCFLCNMGCGGFVDCIVVCPLGPARGFLFDDGG